MHAEILNVEEAAEFLKVKIATIYAWVHQRKIPFRKHGSRVVFHRVDLLDWSAHQAVDPILPTALGICGNLERTREELPSFFENRRTHRRGIA